MAKRQSDFREDREFSFDPPSDDAPRRAKVDHQKRLLKAWKDAENMKPSAILSIPMEDQARWWTRAEGLSPEQEEARRRKRIERGY